MDQFLVIIHNSLDIIAIDLFLFNNGLDLDSYAILFVLFQILII
jgi:hypothetical protein